MNISLPEALRSFIDEQVADGSYSSSSEYVRDLLRREQERVRVRELLLEGGVSPLSDTVWDEKHFEKMRQRVKTQKK
jgi:antitoxin ParD1/3/4